MYHCPADEPVTLVADKTRILPPGDRHQRRHRLTAMIDDALGNNRMILVRGHAGCGKSSLLREWADDHRTRTGWVTVDRYDNDDRRLWMSILVALHSTGLDCSALPDLCNVPFNPGRNGAFLAQIVNGVSAFVQPCALVLDNVHELVDPSTLAGLVNFIRDRPRQLELLIATRGRLRLGLEREHLLGRVSEITPAQLAFTRDEAAGMFADAGLAMGGNQLDHLMQDTGGWAAALSFTASDTAHRPEGNAPFTLPPILSDYIEEEVVAPLPEYLRTFLPLLSLNETISVPLLIALSNQEDAGMLLRALEHDWSLIARDEENEGCYRLNPALRASLHHMLVQRQPLIASRLHGAAADYFDRSRQTATALSHAIVAADPVRIVGMIRAKGAYLTATGAHLSVLSALALVASETVAQDPWLSLCAAMASLEIGNLASADVHIGHLDRAWPVDPSPDLQWLRRILHARREWLNGGYDGLDMEEGEEARSWPHGPVGCAAEFVRTSIMITGRRSSEQDRMLAERSAQVATDEFIDSGNAHLAVHGLAVLGLGAALGGNLHHMESLLDQAESLADQSLWSTEEGAHITVLRCYGAVMRSEPAESLRILQEHGANPVLRAPLMVPICRLFEALARFDLGERATGLEAMRQARLAIPADYPPIHVTSQTVLFEHEWAIAMGRMAHAREVADWAEARLDDPAALLLMRGAQAFHAGRFHACSRHLRPLLDGDTPMIVPWTILSGWLLECEAALLAGKQQRAAQALDQLVTGSARMGISRILCHASPTVINFMTARLGNLGLFEPFARGILGKRSSLTPRHVPSLSDKEWTVLSMLQSYRSLDEIAGDLNLSINTIKSHLRSIYGKLEVNSRRSAIEVALRFGLLHPSTANSPFEGDSRAIVMR